MNDPKRLGLAAEPMASGLKLGLLLLIASLISNRILPKEIGVETSHWLAPGLFVGFHIVHWLVWIVGAGLTLLGAARIFAIHVR